MSKKLIKVLFLVLIIVLLVSGCSGKNNDTVQETANEFEKESIKVAKEFVLATQGDKEKIKKLSFPTLLKEIEDKNWSIMLVKEIKIKPETFQVNVESLSEKQLMVKLFYEAEMKKNGEAITVKLSNKLGIIKHDEKPLVFSFE